MVQLPHFVVVCWLSLNALRLPKAAVLSHLKEITKYLHLGKYVHKMRCAIIL